MLNAVIAFSLRRRFLIVALSLFVLVYGSYLATTFPIDVFPDLDRPRVVVMTDAIGLAPEEVETLVTFPLEAQMLGAHGVQDVRSQSGPELSVITVDFDWSVDIHRARQVVKERIDAARALLPAGPAPVMAPIGSVMGQIMVSGVYRKGDAPPGDDLALRSVADWLIRPRLLQIPGIAQVVVVGGGRKQYQVRVDPSLLAEFDVSLKDVEEALRRNNLNASGGFLERGDNEVAVRIFGRLGDTPGEAIANLKRIPVKGTKHRAIVLGQLATIAEGSAPRRGDGSVDGRGGVVLSIQKQPHVDTRRLTEKVQSALEELRPALPADVELVPDLFLMRNFIDRGIYNVGESLVLGATLVLVILLVFLLNVRTTFISLTAIPLSLTLTALVFKLVSWLTGAQLSINVMTLGGIAVAMGELVDDAIVDVENIYRRLRENGQSPRPKPALQVVYDASAEVRSAIVFGTATVILVFLPLFALPGIEGRLFAPLGVAYISSILASLVVSMTVTPALSYYLLARTAGSLSHQDGIVVRVLKFLASYLVRFSMSKAGSLLAMTWVSVAFAVWLLIQLGADFLPPFDEGAVQVNVTLPSGSSLAASARTAKAVETVFRSLQATADQPDLPLLHFTRRTGRAELEEHVEPPGNSEYLVSINPRYPKQRDVVLRELMEKLRQETPGVDLEIEQPLAHLISHMISGVQAQIAIKIYGDDLGTLARLARQAKSAILTTPGVSTPVIEPLQQIDELHLRIKPTELMELGLDRQSVAEFVQTAVRGEVVSQIIEGERRFDLTLRLEDPYRTDPTQLARLRLELPGGGQAALGEVATLEFGSGPNQTKRENARRRIVLRCNSLGRDLQSLSNDIRKRVTERVDLPEGYFIEYGGQFESQRRATVIIAVLAALSGMGVFVVLLLCFPSVRIVLQILNAIPIAFVGGVVALALTRQTLTVASMVGFISLGGIAARNGILLVTHYLHLMREEGESFTATMVLRGSLERLSPVLMTALTAGIGLAPLVWGGHEPGREILYPVATVILGGLITSTICEFLVHPGLFWRFSGKDAERLAQASVEDVQV